MEMMDNALGSRILQQYLWRSSDATSIGSGNSRIVNVLQSGQSIGDLQVRDVKAKQKCT